MKFKGVIKRSGTTVPFNRNRIMNAIYRAAVSVGGRDKERADILAEKVIQLLERTFDDDHLLHVEEVQDAIEKILIEYGHAKVAKEFIIYRDEQNRKRQEDAKLASKPDENIPWPKMWRVLNWAARLPFLYLLRNALTLKTKNCSIPYSCCCLARSKGPITLAVSLMS